MTPRDANDFENVKSHAREKPLLARCRVRCLTRFLTKLARQENHPKSRKQIPSVWKQIDANFEAMIDSLQISCCYTFCKLYLHFISCSVLLLRILSKQTKRVGFCRYFSHWSSQLRFLAKNLKKSRKNGSWQDRFSENYTF